MKLLLIGVLFAPLLYYAFRQKKWYLYLFFAFAGILPEQFTIELHEKLPLLSGTRILILILLGFWLYDKWKTRKFSFPISLVLFFAINVAVSLVNLRYGGGEINRIFLLIFERVLLVIMLADLIKSREEFERCMDSLIMGCTVLAIISIVQTVFEYDIVSVLRLKETLATVKLESRMGLTRAYGSFNAISYGCYCAFMTLPILYRLERTGLQRYSAAFALNFTALFCTMTRSAWLCIGGIGLLMIILRRGKLIKRMVPSMLMIAVLVTSLFFVQPKLMDALVETGKSTINTLLDVIPQSMLPSTPPATEPPAPETVPAETKPAAVKPTEKPGDIGFELSEDFGMNGEDPTYSRMAQWTAVQYMANEGELLFGYGYNPFFRGKLHYFYDRWGARWGVATTLDVGLIALVTECGLVGSLPFLALLGYIFVYAFRRRGAKDPLGFYAMTAYMIPLYLLLNFLAAFLNPAVVWMYFGLFYAYRKLDKNGLAEDHALPAADRPMKF